MIAYCIGFVAGSGVTGILGLAWAFWLSRRHPALRRAYEQDERERIRR